MNGPFAIVLALAGALLLLVVVLMWRARRTARAAPPKPIGAARRRGNLRDGLRRRYAVVERAVRYVLARRDWRYRSSWLLLVGLPGDGKSSLAASLPDSMKRRQQRGDAVHEAYLRAAVPHTQWHFLEQGILIDPGSSLLGPMGDAGVDARWRTMLDDIESLRPDRAVDGLVWTVSAARLLGAGAAELRQMADQVLQRINAVQEQFAYALPVYVVVTQCDTVPGFRSFWAAQDDARRRELVGWSSPTIDDNGLPAEWVAKAFGRLLDGLGALVLSSAATHDDINDVDGFFLFPQHMRSLQLPLRRFLGVVFKPNMYETRAFCRGIYFTGAGESAAAAGSPRSDVNFVESLMRDKAFAEQRLAQRTRGGLLARNRLIRRLQVGTVAVGLALAVALPWTAARVDAHTESLHDTLVDIAASSTGLSGSGCPDQRRIYRLLEQVAALDTHTRYAAIPASWVDQRINHGVAHLVATDALRLAVLPALKCELQARIAALRSVRLHQADANTSAKSAYLEDRNQLKQQLADLAALEDNLARFEHISLPGRFSEHKALVQQLGQLSEYVYHVALPRSVLRDGTALTDALVEVSYPHDPLLSQPDRTDLTNQLELMATTAGQDLRGRLKAGVPLLAALKQGTLPIMGPLRSFDDWLQWVQADWIPSTDLHNPCAGDSDAIRPGLQALVRKYRYPQSLLANALDSFTPEACYRPAVAALRQATLDPYGPLFRVQPETGVLQGISPQLANESAGLRALADVGYMQQHAPRSFSCGDSAGGWRPGTFDGVLADLRQYQLFVGQQTGAATASAEPLYDRLARAQLQRAIEDALARNQRKPAAPSADGGLDATSQLDQQLSSESDDLAASQGAMLQTLQQLRQLHMDPLADRIGQCARNYASGVLMDVSGLAWASELYAPRAQPATDENAALFDLGSPPVLQAYLDRQLARAQVLAGYASPFVTLLKNSRGVSDSHRLDAQTNAYWDNTINELNRAVQFAEPAGQVGALDDFFLKQLGTLTYANCAASLDAYDAPAAGNDLFSLRRQAMQNLAQLTCATRGQDDSDLHYYRIAMLFNSELAGRYPFGPSGSHEVSLATVKAFFVYYASEKPTLESWLATAKGDRARRMKAFIDQLDKVQQFFAGNLSATPRSAPITLDVGFRALPQSSPMSNQLIGWSLATGGSQAAWPGSTAPLAWGFDQALTLDLQWADRSRYTPLPDAAQPDLQVSGYRASFQASGPWALLHFIDAHQPTDASANPLDPARQLLEFRLPVQHSATATATALAQTGPAQTARLYLTLGLSASDPATKAVVPLTVPVFPQLAPQLW